MVAGEIELRETELIVMQHLLGGDNFGAGYDEFRNKNLNAAQFKTDRRGNIYRTAVVETAQAGGRLAELRFRIEAPTEDEDSKRQIKVVTNRDGFFRSRQRAQDELLDQFFGNLAIVLGYRDKLVPLDKRLDDYIEYKNFGMGESRRRLLMEVDRAFKNLIKQNFNAMEFDKGEIEVYMSIIANAGIELSKIDLTDDELPSVTGFDGDNIDYFGKVSDFFETYAAYVEDGFRPDFDLLAGHLHHILTYSDGYDSLTGMLTYIENTYDI